MTESSARHALPLIAPGQAQKELSHNEALALVDLLLQPAVVAAGTDTPPAAPASGQCWIVGAAPTGAWTGHAAAVAGWTSGGWRFAAPREGMRAWTGPGGAELRYTGGGWQTEALAGSMVRIGGVQVVGARRPAIAGPAGGATNDAEARAAIEQVLSALRTHGLIAD